METIIQMQRTISYDLTDQDTDLGIWLEAFIGAKISAGKAHGTIEWYKEKLAYFVRFCEGKYIKQITQITAGDIREFMLQLEESGHNPGGRHACYRAIKAFLYWWEKEIEPPGWRNPIKKIEAPKVELEPLEPANPADIKAILETCGNDFEGVRDRAMLLVLLDTGARAEELLSLKISDINIITGEVLIRHGKGNKSRYTFINSTARKAYRSYLRAIKAAPNSPAWIKADGERITYSSLRSRLRARAGLAGLDRIPMPHSFRRLCALTMYRATHDIYAVGKYLGHSGPTVTQRYLRLTPDDAMRTHQQGSPVELLLK